MRQDEKALLLALLAEKPEAVTILHRLSSYVVEDMSDGGMGSVRVVAPSGSDDRRIGNVIARAEFADADGVPVIVTVNTDNFGELYEIDIWKVDFSPLKTYPRAFAS